MTHFGPRVIGQEAFEKERAIQEAGADHFGPRVVGKPAFGPRVTVDSSEEKELEGHASWLFSNTVVNIVEMLKTFHDVAELRRIYETEEANPKWENGRRGVLNAIEERIGEISAGAPPEDSSESGSAEEEEEEEEEE